MSQRLAFRADETDRRLFVQAAVQEIDISRTAQRVRNCVTAVTDALHATKVADALGSNVRAVRPEDIARDADVVIVATPYGAAVEALRAAGDLTGKTVIDITNPLTADMSGLSVGFTSSAAEEIQRAIPSAYVEGIQHSVCASARLTNSKQRAGVLLG